MSTQGNFALATQFYTGYNPLKNIPIFFGLPLVLFNATSVCTVKLRCNICSPQKT